VRACVRACGETRAVRAAAVAAKARASLSHSRALPFLKSCSPRGAGGGCRLAQGAELAPLRVEWRVFGAAAGAVGGGGGKVSEKVGCLLAG
jgi:hypothetical protein